MSTAYVSFVETAGEVVVSQKTPDWWLSPKVTQNDFIVPTITLGLYQLGLDVKGSYTIGEVPNDTLVKRWTRLSAQRVSIGFLFEGDVTVIRNFEINRKRLGVNITDETVLLTKFDSENYGFWQGVYSEDAPTPLAIELKFQLCFIGFPAPFQGTSDEEATDQCFYRPDTDLWFPSLAVSVVVTYGSNVAYWENYSVTDPDYIPTFSFAASWKDAPFTANPITMDVRTLSSGIPVMFASLDLTPISYYNWAEPLPIWETATGKLLRFPTLA